MLMEEVFYPVSTAGDIDFNERALEILGSVNDKRVK